MGREYSRHLPEVWQCDKIWSFSGMANIHQSLNNGSNTKQVDYSELRYSDFSFYASQHHSCHRSLKFPWTWRMEGITWKSLENLGLCPPSLPMQRAIYLIINLWGNFEQCIYIWHLCYLKSLNCKTVYCWKPDSHILEDSLLTYFSSARVEGQEDSSEDTDEQTAARAWKGPREHLFSLFLLVVTQIVSKT